MKATGEYQGHFLKAKCDLSGRPRTLGYDQTLKHPDRLLPQIASITVGTLDADCDEANLPLITDDG